MERNKKMMCKYGILMIIVVITPIFLVGMNKEESLSLLNTIGTMQRYYQHEIPEALERVLYKPIIPKHKEQVSLSQAMKNSNEEMIDKSPLWFFASLSKELQRKVVESMMQYNPVAVEKFLRTPFLYAMDRFSRLVAIQDEYALHHMDIAQLFISLSPYKSQALQLCVMPTEIDSVGCICAGVGSMWGGSVGAFFSCSGVCIGAGIGGSVFGCLYYTLKILLSQKKIPYEFFKK